MNGHAHYPNRNCIVGVTKVRGKPTSVEIGEVGDNGALYKEEFKLVHKRIFGFAVFRRPFIVETNTGRILIRPERSPSPSPLFSGLKWR